MTLVKTYGILVCGWPSPSVVAKYGGYGAMLERLLSSPGESWRHFDVEGGRDLPSDADLARLDGLVISGSRHAVYDDEPWIKSVSALVKSAVDRKQKVLGICFGAQLLAQCLGGRVERAPYWEAGARQVGPYRVCQMHRDAIVELPPGLELRVSSRRCENEIFGGDNVLAVQGHPEFEVDAARAILETRLDIISQEDADLAFESLTKWPPPSPTSDDPGTLRQLCKTFLHD